MKRFCRNCNKEHSVEEFYIYRDGKKLLTANCAKSISEQNKQFNREQKKRLK